MLYHNYTNQELYFIMKNIYFITMITLNLVCVVIFFNVINVDLMGKEDIYSGCAI